VNIVLYSLMSYAITIVISLLVIGFVVFLSKTFSRHSKAGAE